MLVCDNQIRLTEKESTQLLALTGVPATGITRRSQLECYIHEHLDALPRRFCGPSACFARRLLLSFLPPHSPRVSRPG
ncbi:MAG TPA: hypothetical protein ENJ19_11075 [Gammaproteobacteria bacterium]|nr:hypothetical protein [Gammaproteobacteria bacterium]